MAEQIEAKANSAANKPSGASAAAGGVVPRVEEGAAAFIALVVSPVGAFTTIDDFPGF